SSSFDGEPKEDDEALDAYSRVITRVADRLIPSVGNLRVTRRGWRGPEAQGGGSGVVITPDGFILTSAHVVAGSNRGSASFADGTEFGIEIVGTDPLSDLAVLRAAAASLTPAQLGDASRLKVGQLVVAIGNPLDDAPHRGRSHDGGTVPACLLRDRRRAAAASAPRDSRDRTGARGGGRSGGRRKSSRPVWNPAGGSAARRGRYPGGGDGRPPAAHGRGDHRSDGAVAALPRGTIADGRPHPDRAQHHLGPAEPLLTPTDV